MKGITAVIPVRKGSVRCKHKNIRGFSRSTLLEMKIKTLKSVHHISEIIVSSDCDTMLSIAERCGVKTHKREPYYASSECPNYEYWEHIAQTVGVYSDFMMVNCVSPFVDNVIIDKLINKYITDDTISSIVTVNRQKKFFYDMETSEPVNFDNNNAPNSQQLKALGEITFGVCICNRYEIIKSKCIYGVKPYLYVLDSIQSIDIDNPYEFIISELLQNHDITNTMTTKIILEKRKRTELLDCTIRDGGYLNNWEFTLDEVRDCYKSISQAGYDYFEIGFKTNKELLAGKGRWCYCSEEDVDLVANSFNGCKIAVMAKMGTFRISDFKCKDKSNISMIRVLIARSHCIGDTLICEYDEKDIINTKSTCIELMALGYEVTLNFGCGDLINDNEIETICRHFHDVPLKALYLADTYGGFDDISLPKQIHKFYRGMELYGGFKSSFGFHCHDNGQNSIHKTNLAIFHGCTMVDTCIGGLGRGAGNLKSEIFLCNMYESGYIGIGNIVSVIKWYSKYIMSKNEYSMQKYPNYHPYYVLSGVLSLHPNYILEILQNYDSSVEEDITLIMKLNDYTIETNARNYDATLIKRM